MTDSLNTHRLVAGLVPDHPEAIGLVELGKRLGWRQRGRVKRAVVTLVAYDVLQWSNSRSVTQGPASLDEVAAAGGVPLPDREMATYPLLTDPIDRMVSESVIANGLSIDDRTANDGSDGVVPYITASLRAGSGAHTRPDITVVVDLALPHAGRWRDVHAVEVKPYWAVDRSALFEAAAQAALGRCSHSWLVVWIPDADSPSIPAQLHSRVVEAHHVLGVELAGRRRRTMQGRTLRKEAEELGIGLALARELNPDSSLELLVAPRRRAMDPLAADDLFSKLPPQE
jgi:hypothetical protein